VPRLKGGLAEWFVGLAEQKDGLVKLTDGLGGQKVGLAEQKVGLAEVTDGLAEQKVGLVEPVDGLAELTDGLVEPKDGLDKCFRQGAAVPGGQANGSGGLAAGIWVSSVGIGGQNPAGFRRQNYLVSGHVRHRPPADRHRRRQGFPPAEVSLTSPN